MLRFGSGRGRVSGHGGHHGLSSLSWLSSYSRGFMIVILAAQLLATFFSPINLVVEGHVRKFCRTESLPVVVIERVHNSNAGDDPQQPSSSFRVVERYDASEVSQAYEDYNGVNTRRRNLFGRANYDEHEEQQQQHSFRDQKYESPLPIKEQHSYNVDDNKSSSWWWWGWRGQPQQYQEQPTGRYLRSSSLLFTVNAVPAIRMLVDSSDLTNQSLPSTTTLLDSLLSMSSNGVDCMESVNSSNSTNSTHNNNGDSTTPQQKDPEYFMAKECSCFVKENYETVLCPFATNQCGQVVDDHADRPTGGYHPETLMCYSEPLQRSNSNTYKILWLFTIVVWANFLFALVMTPKGRSCLSFIPSRLPWVKERWNPSVADYLLEHHRDQAYRMIRTHVYVIREQLHYDFEREQRRQERARRRNRRRGGGDVDSNNNNNNVNNDVIVNQITGMRSNNPNANRRTAAMIELVTNIGGGTGTGRSNGQRQERPTSLVLQTKLYRKPTDVTKASVASAADTSTVSGVPSSNDENIKAASDISNSEIGDSDQDRDDDIHHHHNADVNEAEDDTDHDIIHDDDNDDDDRDDAHQCAICYTAFEDGDRVGSLPCGHVFHADCLKSWLKRQNVCPFCRKDHVAEERFGPIELNNDDDDDDDDENNEDDENKDRGDDSDGGEGNSSSNDDDDDGDNDDSDNVDSSDHDDSTNVAETSTATLSEQTESISGGSATTTTPTTTEENTPSTDTRTTTEEEDHR